MKNFNLKTKCGEVINKCKATNLDEAIVFFSKIKQVSKEVLLKLFVVER